MNPFKFFSVLWLSGSVLGLALPALAQSIVPEANNPTQVTTTGNQVTISGGVRSANGRNLFHGFEQFGLSASEVATFLAQPRVQAIFGRVSGGDVSRIDGLLRVSGSNADLYLINPAGILIGPNAQLDLTGSFTATTASGVQFRGGVLNAVGRSDYAALGGAPRGLIFATNATGAIVNEANLVVAPGEAIALIGGQVITLGTLDAPGGEVTIAAVSGGQLVRISHADLLLNLELAALPGGTAAQPLSFDPVSLPALLTGGEAGGATGVAVNPDGTISLVNVATPIADVAGSAIASGTINVSGPQGGSVTVVGDRVGVLNATLQADGNSGGGTVRIGGDYLGQDTLPGSQITVVDGDTRITANGGTTGTGGRIILWSDGLTAFSGDIEAQGGAIAGDGGFVEVSGAQTLVFRGTVDTTAVAGQTGQLLLDPANITIRDGVNDGNDTDGNAFDLSETNIAVGDPIPTVIYESELENTAGNTNLTLRASNTITVEDLTDNELTFQSGTGSITFIAGNAFVMTDRNDAIVAPGRSLTIRADRITAGTLNTSTPDSNAQGGDVRLIASGAVVVDDILTTGDPIGDPGASGSGDVVVRGSRVRTGSITAGEGFGDRGSVTLTSTSGNVIVDTIVAGGGGITLKAARRFQARESFVNNLRISLNSATDGELIDFLMRGDPQPLYDAGLVDTADQVFIRIPTSVFALPGGGQPANITIRHGGVGSYSDGNITIQGSGAYPNIGFAAGPQPDHTIFIDDGVPVAEFENFSTLYPAGTFPNDLSGATGAILRGQGDATLVTSFQNQVFLPEDPTGGLAINTASLERLDTAANDVETPTDTDAAIADQDDDAVCATTATQPDAETVEIVTECETHEAPPAE
ncbi:MAG: filamentous hemagglutinin N-terminal domain-containing protein [Leptolyngbyaceae cyanobacterium T60_A2020_046]|nr:filamentous hemagglutinin N-terminal domain-containing protein [Leptolyngbyaceae cyanobacterium T60_A2020_046]